jgi:predicted ATPase
MRPDGSLPTTRHVSMQFAPTRELTFETEVISPSTGIVSTHGAANASTLSEATRDTLPMGNLPRQMTSFVGRGIEVAEIQSLMTTNRLVTLIGVGGMGKTRLALEVATAAAVEYRDGVWLVELGKVLSPSLVPQAIATVLEIREDVEGSLLAKIAKTLRRQRLLLVVDNCEHVVESTGEAIETILKACPDVSVLATSREALGLGGEIVRSVPPLTTPDPEALPPDDEVLGFEAVRLFVDRARLGKPSFALTSRNAKSIAQICRRLDGVPLAIELAASRVRMLPVDQILARLNDRFEFLVRGPRAALPHQQTLRATIDWSYNLLLDEEKVLLRRLAVFGGGFTLGAAEAVCAGGDVEEGSVEYLLERLVDKSLVIAEDVGESTRFRMLETVHQYAVELLAGSDEDSTIRAAHLAWYTRFAESTNAQFTGEEVSAWIARFRTEEYNVDAAMLWARAERDDESLFRLVDAQHWYWYVSESWDKIRRWLLVPMPSLSASENARVAFLRGSFEFLRGNYESAEALLEECLAAELEPKRRLNAITRLGTVKSLLGKNDRARDLYEEALAIGRDIGDEFEVAATTLHLAALARDQGEYDDAHAIAERAMKTLETLGRRDAILSGGRAVLADIARLRGDYERAIDLCERQLNDLRAIGFTAGIAGATYCRADIARAVGDFAGAVARYRQVIELSRDAGDKASVASALDGLAIAMAAGGRAEYALRLAGAGAALREEIKAAKSPSEAAELDAAIQTATAALGADEAARAYEAGHSMSHEEAVDYALGTGQYPER